MVPSLALRARHPFYARWQAFLFISGTSYSAYGFCDGSFLLLLLGPHPLAGPASTPVKRAHWPRKAIRLIIER